MNWNDIAVRAAKTAAQAFLAVVIAQGVTSFGDFSLELLDAAGIAALGALLSFVNNVLIQVQE